MSILGKKWIIKNTETKLSPLQKILQNRNQQSLDENLQFHDPFAFTQMETAIQRIETAISNQEKIIIFGDYDVDGITGTAILFQILHRLKAKVSFRLPNREKDGYGLNEKFIDEFIGKKINLIITVDCGISCNSQIKKAAQNNIDTIITDHHTIPENFPKDAVAIIHPRLDTSYPYDELTGAGVALKLAQALISRHFPPEKAQQILTPLIDLASLGTVADLGPITGENKHIVKTGINSLQNTKNHGLKKLMDLASIKQGDQITTYTIGFKVAPRINAAGRIGDPYKALFLLLQVDQSQKTQELISTLATELEELNDQRRALTEQAIETAVTNIQKTEKIPNIIIEHHPDWHVGILGLIAGRLTEQFVRPAIILQDHGETLTASARSIEDFNIIQAITKCQDLLINFGGHAQAAGLSIKKENLKPFIKKMNSIVSQQIKPQNLVSKIYIDCTVKFPDLNLLFSDSLKQLEPFGIQNEQPVFLIKGVEPYFIKTVGREQNHLKFTIRKENQEIDVIAFQMGQFVDHLRKHRNIDLVFNLEENTWNNRKKLQLKALDFSLSGE